MAEVAESRPLEGSVDARTPQGQATDGDTGERTAAAQGN
jgi:hypothetical protein